MDNADWHHCGHSQVTFHSLRVIDLGDTFSETPIYQCRSCGHLLTACELPLKTTISGVIPIKPVPNAKRVRCKCDNCDKRRMTTPVVAGPGVMAYFCRDCLQSFYSA